MFSADTRFLEMIGNQRMFLASPPRIGVKYLLALFIALSMMLPALAVAQDSTPTADGKPAPSKCSDGQLRVGDLQHLDQEWEKQREIL